MSSESPVPDGVETDVLVVGAGPTGLMLANWLARYGVDVMVVDRKSGPTRESRALGVQARTMEIYDQLGVVDQVRAEAQEASVLVPGFEKRLFSPIPVGRLGSGLTPYPRIYILEQSSNERILYEHLRSQGRDVLWDHGLLSLDDSSPADPAGRCVTAVVSSPGEEAFTIRARYCVGADGGSSVVRKLRGIPFVGSTNAHVFFVSDARGVRGLVPGGINLRFGDTDFLLTFPMGADHDRLLGVVPIDDETAERDIVEEVVRRRVERFFGVVYRDSAWFATYRVHHRVAERFRDGPFFLAGDAAHVHSPVGAQGMNTGLQDAHNLAFRLADVILHGAEESTLDRYEAERRPIAEWLVATTDRVFGVVTSGTSAARFFRRWVLPAVAPIATSTVPRVRGANRLFQYVSQIRIHYWMSTAEHERGVRDPVIGRRLSWVPRADGSNFDALREPVWQVHEYGSVDPAVVRSVRETLGLPTHVYRAAPTTPLRPGVFYLVRPDGFVAAEARAADVPAVFAPLVPPRAAVPS